MADDPAIILKVEAASLHYGGGAPVLHAIDLSITAGSFHFLVGHSGAGKTSMLRLLSLSRPIAQGSIMLFGRDTARLDRPALAAVRRRIGVVSNDLRLLDHMSVFDNVALPLRIAGTGEERIAAPVVDLLGWLGLGDRLEARPPELAIGQRQLVAAARAVIIRPALLLVDEPCAGADAVVAERLIQLYGALHRLGSAVVLATRSDELLRRFAHPRIEMVAGRAHLGGAALSLAAE